MSATQLLELWDSYPIKYFNTTIRYSIPILISYERLIILKRFKSIIHELDPFDNSDEIFIKLDKTENSNRMRRRIKRFLIFFL